MRVQGRRRGRWRGEGRQAPVVGLALAVASALACAGPPPPSPPPPAELDFPAAYRVEALGDVGIEDIRVPGSLRMDYLVYPDGGVVVTQLAAWVSDLDIVVRFLFWETDRERLRCNQMESTEPIVGRLSGTTITIPSDAAHLEGFSFAERRPDGVCPGLARQVSASNNAPFTVVHDPAANRFAVATSFRGDYDGNAVTIRIDLEGRFINRPPIAELGVGAPDLSWDRIQGGCPPLGKQNPPAVLANSPEGLRVNLLSLSYDLDNEGANLLGAKFERADISFEQWARSSDGGFQYIGEGRFIGPVLFENFKDHVLMLTVTDRTGARARKVCRFRVEPS